MISACTEKKVKCPRGEWNVTEKGFLVGFTLLCNINITLRSTSQHCGISAQITKPSLSQTSQKDICKLVSWPLKAQSCHVYLAI